MSLSHSGYGGLEVPYPMPKDFTCRKTSLYSIDPLERDCSGDERVVVPPSTLSAQSDTLDPSETAAGFGWCMMNKHWY